MLVDTVVVGAGLVGLAVARALARSGREVMVLERHGQIGTETSSRNSEVIHAGIYYPRDSLKAQLCVRGKQMLYTYCQQRGVEHRKLGKLIVATSEDQCSALNELYRQGISNGVKDLQWVEQPQLADMEPNLNGHRAILSPSTGIVDSHQLMLALQADLEAAGGHIGFHAEVTAVSRKGQKFELQVGSQGEVSLSCHYLVNCAGLGSVALSRLLANLEPAALPTTYYSKGCYFSYSGAAPFSRLIYPLPNNEGLGVHVTLDLAGNVRFGPDSHWVDRPNYQVPDRAGRSFIESIKSYFPRLCCERLMPSYCGIRPKIVGPGQPAEDFRIDDAAVHGVEGYVALYGIESPGLTSALSIAERVAAFVR